MNESVVTIHVELGERRYAIDIGTGILEQIGPRIIERCRLTHAVVIADEHVPAHAESVLRSLSDAGLRTSQCLVPAGERSKSITHAEQLWNQLLAEATDRKSAVFAVGGGVVGDLAGFVAATFARGLRFCQLPTTLLSQVDSSVGGKVGVNLAGGKNMVGAFWQPQYVLIDTDVLTTLPDREYRSGLAEVVKYGVILDADFFDFLAAHVDGLIQRDPSVLRHVISRSCQLKADIVEADERETLGLRAVLNYGHTFAHALEAVTGYGELLHGEAVSIGMICASQLATRLGKIDASMTARQADLLGGLQLPTQLPDLADDALIAAMQSDKKVEHGQLRFVLPTRMGHVELVADVPTKEVERALNDCR